MKVYRVEHRKSGSGPYRHEGPECIYHHEHLKPVLIFEDTHPLPFEDGIAHLDTWGGRSGFKSKAQLKAWFGHCLDGLFDLGYHVVVYNVPKRGVAMGKPDAKQIAFVPSMANPIAVYTDRIALKL